MVGERQTDTPYREIWDIESIKLVYEGKERRGEVRKGKERGERQKLPLQEKGRGRES